MTHNHEIVVATQNYVKVILPYLAELDDTDRAFRIQTIADLVHASLEVLSGPEMTVKEYIEARPALLSRYSVKPKLSDFNDVGAYTEAFTEWKLEQRAAFAKQAMFAAKRAA